MSSNKISQPEGKGDSYQAPVHQGLPGVNSYSLNTPDLDILPELISELIKKGHQVRFRAPGKSMQPAVLDGDVLIIEPVEPNAIKIGDIILYRAEERMIAHRVICIEKVEFRRHQSSKSSAGPSLTLSNPVDCPTNDNFYAFLLCGDASFSYDEPVYADQIMGRAVTIERNGRPINPYSLFYRLTCRARVWASRLKRIYF